jgi:hypothetical protein
VPFVGDDSEVESHHVMVEWAFSDAVDWEWIKGVALGTTKTMWSRTLKKEIPIPPRHMIWIFLLWTKGFDWANFDTSHPETFVDSVYNQLPLCEMHHRGRYHGIHMVTFPVWMVQGFIQKDFVFSPDELDQANKQVVKFIPRGV